MKIFIAILILAWASFSAVNAQKNSFLLKDIKRGKLGSNPTSLVAADGFVYFAADDGINGTQLWKTDGTETGTQIVRVLPSHGIFNLTNVQGKIYFFVYYNSKTFLWKSDGTEAGTELVTELNAYVSSIANCRNVNGIFTFTLANSTYPGLWRSDGTPQGTFRLKSFDAVDLVSGFVHLDGTLYFSVSANYGFMPPDLWKTNGTVEGTQLVRAGLPGLGQMTDVNNTLYFVSGTALWKTNGTNATTTLIIDLQNPIANLTVNNSGEMYFTRFNVKDSINELWKSDGTQDGTKKVAIIPFQYPSHPYQLKAVGNRVFFTAGFNSELELFTSNGTEAGTGLVRDIYFNYSSMPNSFLEIDGMLYFMTYHQGLQMSEIWRTDGTLQGTRRIDSNGNLTSYQSAMVYENGMLYFPGYNQITNEFGQELWALDIRKITDVADPETPIVSSTLHIYPNPFKNSATISVLGGNTHNTEYVLFDVLGREVRRFKSDISDVTLDRNLLPAGTYTLQMSNKSGTVFQRLLIMD